MERIAKAKEVVAMINGLMENEDFEPSVVSVSFYEDTIETKLMFKKKREIRITLSEERKD